MHLCQGNSGDFKSWVKAVWDTVLQFMKWIFVKIHQCCRGFMFCRKFPDELFSKTVQSYSFYWNIVLWILFEKWSTWVGQSTFIMGLVLSVVTCLTFDGRGFSNSHFYAYFGSVVLKLFLVVTHFPYMVLVDGPPPSIIHDYSDCPQSYTHQVHIRSQQFWKYWFH